jgi:hypothetical protein
LTAAVGYLQTAENVVARVGSLTSLSQINTSGTLLNGTPIENLTIYVPSTQTGGTIGQGGAPAAQEFVTVSVDEPPYLAGFAVYFLAGGGSLLLFSRRRHIFKAVSRV